MRNQTPEPPHRAGAGIAALAAPVLAVATLTATATAQPQEPPPPEFCDFTAVDRRIERMLRDFPTLPGAGVIVGDRSGVVHEAYFGDYDASTVVPLASASKLVSAASIMTLVDDGLLDLDAPVRRYLPEEFSTENAGMQKSRLTADQMYSMTSGFPGGDQRTLIGDPTLTNDEAVAEIACCVDLASTPGTDLRYGGYGMHVVGRVAEVLTNREFDDFFNEAINIPLGTNITWDGLGDTENYRPSGGGAASLPDYARILQMLLRRGELDGVRVLQPASVQSMFNERTLGLPQAEVPPTVTPEFGYAFGMWVEQRTQSGFPAVLTSPGAFGFTPVLDIQDNYFVAVMVRGSNGQLDESIDEIRERVEEVMRGGCRSCPGDTNRSGVLNSTDINAFVAAFLDETTPADVAEPRGIYNSTDINTFVASFLEGCP